MNSIIEKITVVDAIPGSGKTTWAINFMQEEDDTRFIYCTPRLTEIKRIQDDCTTRFIADPKKWEQRKIDDFNDLIAEGQDIAVTHRTFCNSNERTIQLLQEKKYTLILDETIDVLDDLNSACNDTINKDDIKMLTRENFISVDEYGKVSWIKPSYEGSKFSNVERVAKSGNLFMLDKTMLIWQFPPEIFGLFERVYILTYLFPASMMCPYFAYHGIDYCTKSIGRDSNGRPSLTEFNSYVSERLQFKELISILDNEKMNNYTGGLSKTTFCNHSDKEFDILRRHMQNYIHNIIKAKAGRIMWTTYKENYDKLKGRGYVRTRRLNKDEKASPKPKLDELKYKTSCFVPCTERGVNHFSDRNVLMYILNLYPNQIITRLFYKKNKADGTQIKFNNDYYALAGMLQWIWRSAIRENKPIQIYIPSTRMRKLLTEWLDGKEYNDH